MERKALTQKVIVLGVDGFDPKLAKKFMDQGKMPALKEFTLKGSAREDLVLLGAMPTVTPALWTTLATGAYPGTHGITCFFASDSVYLDTMYYNLDSRKCKAEPLWNVFAEKANKKTLVWHWPGSSWPPTSDSPNLHVVDGTQPSGINNGIPFLDILKVVAGSEKLTVSEYLPNTSHVAPGQGCIIDNVEDLMDNGSEAETSYFRKVISSGNNSKGFQFSIMKDEECGIEALGNMVCDTIKAAIKPASGWIQAPQDAKEFTFIVSNGLERRPALILKNEQGIYDTVQFFKSKKETTSYLTLKNGEIRFDVRDTAKNDKGADVACDRNYQLLDLAKDGSKFNIIINNASQVGRDDYFHPKSLYKEVLENIGNVPVNFRVNGSNETLVRNTMLPSWEHYCEWQAKCLTYFMTNNKYDIIFSHLHNLDGVGHYYWHYACRQDEWNNNEAAYQIFQEEAYRQTDRYLSHFLPFLDQGWTIIITSDHGLLTQEYHGVILGEIHGVNVPVMSQLGYTVMIKDEKGNETKEIDWSKTKAIAIRGDYIYINLKGRNPQGIVDPADKYELETQIISDLYNYRDPRTGRRVVSVAMRNKDAVLLGMGGPECGDIIYFTEEGYNKIHADSLSTQCGYADTSVSPIFVAAGPGIKTNCVTKRVIRQVDVVPTIATITGVRMPAQCEGAPVYQIIAE
ncbi:alkaline phosphatase family protein [Desulfitobacterium sp. AusDCA]|uniref:alkaline phosphatase family protein n=1 Tax=Desulfitobacterium sp. AusDCA TaxID=3240383 RepID=UPI003DA77FE1